MQRITNTMINDAIARYRRACEALELPHGPLQYQQGGPSTNVSYRLYLIGEHGSATPAVGTDNGYLGETRREAYETIRTIARTLEDVHWNRGQL